MRPLVDISGWPWLTAKCCGTRVNHCGEVKAMERPQKYGDTEATHTQERSCKCGKTVLIVEGTLQIIDVHGCFATARTTETQQEESPSESEARADEAEIGGL